ncbi:class I SAM-dependent methyltransferase [Streptomyces sp. NPDC050504]|uniref:class I SAM-dependent methyltransferase n=1 Tax=Streptomyces sp. NPDC050504 TaxID=3365618 RepID=UPI0037AB1E67
MPSLLKRVLRPALSLVEQRVERTAASFQADLDALHHQVADLRRQQYALGPLLGERAPTPTQFDTLVREVRAVTGVGEEAARRDVTAAYRTVVALEALGVGLMAEATSDVCGRLAVVPLLSPPGGEVLETGARQGLFAAALLRMLHRAGREARLTLVDPPADAAVLRANLALCGGSSEYRTTGRAGADDRRYGVVVAEGAADLEWLEKLLEPGAVVILGEEPLPGHGLTVLGRVAGSVFLRAN